MKVAVHRTLRVGLRLAILVLWGATTMVLGCGGGGGGGGNGSLAARAWIASNPASPGDPTEAWLMISNAAGVAGLDLELTFDGNSLGVLGVDTTPLTSEFIVAHSDEPAGSLRVSMAHAAGLSGGTASQELLLIGFAVDASAQQGTSIPITVAALDFYDETPSRMTVQIEDGAITVQ